MTAGRQKGGSSRKLPRVGVLKDMPVLVVDDNQTNRRILEEVLTNWGMKPTLAGVGIGIIAALALGRIASSLMYGVSARDLETFVVVTLVLIAVSFAASLVPALRLIMHLTKAARIVGPFELVAPDEAFLVDRVDLVGRKRGAPFLL